MRWGDKSPLLGLETKSLFFSVNRDKKQVLPVQRQELKRESFLNYHMNNGHSYKSKRSQSFMGSLLANADFNVGILCAYSGSRYSD